MSIGGTIARGYRSYVDSASRPGIDYAAPTPFEPGTVSTGAALLKLATGIAATRRHQANYDQALADYRAQEQEKQQKTLADIAQTEAQTKYYGAQAELASRKAPEEALYDVPVDLGNGQIVHVKMNGERAGKYGIANRTLATLRTLRSAQANNQNAHARTAGTGGTEAGAERQALNDRRASIDKDLQAMAERQADAQMVNDQRMMTARHMTTQIGGQIAPLSDDSRAAQLGMTREEMRQVQGDSKRLDAWQKQRRATLVAKNVAALRNQPRIRDAYGKIDARLNQLAQLEGVSNDSLFAPDTAQQGPDPFEQALGGLKDYVNSINQ